MCVSIRFWWREGLSTRAVLKPRTLKVGSATEARALEAEALYTPLLFFLASSLLAAAAFAAEVLRRQRGGGRRQID